MLHRLGPALGVSRFDNQAGAFGLTLQDPVREGQRQRLGGVIEKVQMSARSLAQMTLVTMRLLRMKSFRGARLSRSSLERQGLFSPRTFEFR